MPQLKVGDKIFTIQYDRIISVDTVERLTEKTAFTKKGSKYKIEYSEDLHISSASKSAYYNYVHILDNRELQQKWQRQLVISKLEKTDWKSLSSKKLAEIYNIVNSKLP